MLTRSNKKVSFVSVMGAASGGYVTVYCTVGVSKVHR